jgi:hypothetical protein
LEVISRGRFWWHRSTQRFSTAKSADIVILIDTTGSMSRSIETLKEKCAAFSQALDQQRLDHRFALIGFGDSSEGEWTSVAC